ncbi:hypothetical protein TNCV_4175571 [Trichonephila clavipes]|nr:hypothetical protein TNCV_4175571 [Trichonephila clavipes]
MFSLGDRYGHSACQGNNLVPSASRKVRARCAHTHTACSLALSCWEMNLAYIEDIEQLLDATSGLLEPPDTRVVIRTLHTELGLVLKYNIVPLLYPDSTFSAPESPSLSCQGKANGRSLDGPPCCERRRSTGRTVNIPISLRMIRDAAVQLCRGDLTLRLSH